MPSGIASKTHGTVKTYGTVAADRQKQMSGLEFVRGLAEGTLPLNTIAQTLGYDVTEAASGRVVVTAEPNETHLNPAGTVHGGLAATLLDSCMGLAIWSTLEKGLGQTTLEFKISLVRPITPPEHQRRGHRAQPRPPRRHRRRPHHRLKRPAARSRHDYLPDLRTLMPRPQAGACPEKWKPVFRIMP